MFWKALCFIGWMAHPQASAASPSSDSSHAIEVGFKREKSEKKSSEEKSEEQVRAEQEAERKRKEKLARVVVLKWKETSTDYTDVNVVRNVRSRISRPEAMFFPSVDLYQNGRKVRDRTVIPAMQPAIVPDSNIPVVLKAVEQVSVIPWNGMEPAQWGLKAQELRNLSEQLWFVDRVELREPLFLLYSQIGLSAENQNHPTPPFFEQIGNYTVNYYWYLAAQLAYQEPALMSKLTDQDLAGSIGYYLGQLQQGVYPSFKVDFEQENAFDEEGFVATYEVMINGIPVVLDANAQIDVFLGRTDIYMKRIDSGHGLSERLETVKLEESVYFVRDVARKKMGISFIEQLFLYKNECNPEVDGDILNYLAIYQKLHDKAEIYIAVPEMGNANKVWIWRYDRDSAQLSLVGGGPDGFPVRFAMLFSTGVLYNGAAISVDDDLSDESSLAPDDVVTDARLDVDLESLIIPFNFELRGHYNRLMINFGSEFGYNAADDEGWVEYYQTPNQGGSNEATKNNVENGYQVETVETLDPEGDVVLNQRTFNRKLYLGAGVVLGRDAGIGFGPRFALRWAWSNMPHGLEPTLHFGWAWQPPWPAGGNRVRPLVDLDLRGGALISTHKSLQFAIASASEDESTVSPVFGLGIGIGFTF